jgi:hypothetical protein
MKKVGFLFLFVVILTGAYAQNNLTPDQIRRYANELGVPYEALQGLIDSHRTQTVSQEPIIVNDMADFEFIPGYNVPGTLFQADYYWAQQDGRIIFLSRLSGRSGWDNFQGVPRRFDFTEGDLVTVVFKVSRYPTSYSFDFVSIEKK